MEFNNPWLPGQLLFNLSILQILELVLFFTRNITAWRGCSVFISAHLSKTGLIQGKAVWVTACQIQIETQIHIQIQLQLQIHIQIQIKINVAPPFLNWLRGESGLGHHLPLLLQLMLLFSKKLSARYF